MSFVSERAKQAIAAGGGRHYRGAGLGKLKAWKCPGCNAENAGPLSEGCIACGAGKPGTQVRKPGERIPDGGAKVAEHKPGKSTPETRARAAASALPRARPPMRIPKPTSAAVDYDEVERRVVKVLEQRLGGGYTEAERATLYNALTVYIGAWEDGMIEPDTGLNLEKTRELAAKVSPDEMPPIEAGEAEAEAHGTTETKTTSGDAGAPEYDSSGDADAGDSGDSGATWDDDPDAAEDRARRNSQ